MDTTNDARPGRLVGVRTRTHGRLRRDLEQLRILHWHPQCPFRPRHRQGSCQRHPPQRQNRCYPRQAQGPRAFIEKVTRTPDSVTADDAREALRAGITPDELQDAAGVAALCQSSPAAQTPSTSTCQALPKSTRRQELPSVAAAPGPAHQAGYVPNVSSTPRLPVSRSGPSAQN